MRSLFLVILFPLLAAAQYTPPAVKPPCTSTRTTNCTPQVGRAGSMALPGNVSIGATLLMSPPAGGANFAPALLAAVAAGRDIQLTSGVYNLDNSSGAIDLGAYTGRIHGEGYNTSLICSTLTVNCLTSTGTTGLDISDLQLSFAGSLGARQLTGYPLLIISGSNITLQRLWVHNSNICGLNITSSSHIAIYRVQVWDTRANPTFFANVTDLTVVGLSCHDGQDACFEASYYDDGALHACRDISVDGLVSVNNVEGVIVNSCSNVSINNFSIDQSAKMGMALYQDSSTTTTVFPDNVTISNGSITNSGYGTNPLNSANATGIWMHMDTATATTQHFVLSNLIIQRSAGYGILLADDNTIQLQASNVVLHANGSGTGAVDYVTVGGSGSGYTSGSTCTISGGGGTGAACAAVVSGGHVTSINLKTSGAGYTTTPTVTVTPGTGNIFTALLATAGYPNVYLDGDVVNLSNVQASDGGLQNLYIHSTHRLTSTNFTTINPNQMGATGTSAILNVATGAYAIMNGINIVDTWTGTNRSALTSTPTTGTQIYTGISNSSVAAWPVPTPGNNAAVVGLPVGGLNTFVGTYAGNQATASNNVGIGSSALQNLLGGTSNTAIGKSTCLTATTGSDNTCIGAFADVDAAGALHRTVIGDGASGTVDNSVTIGKTGETVYVPAIVKAGTGTRYLCIDTAGKIISQTTGCSGT